MKLLKYRTAKESGANRVITHRSMFAEEVKEIIQEKHSREAVIITKSGEEIQTIDSKTKLNSQLESNG